MPEHTIGALAPAYFFHLTVPRILALEIELQALQESADGHAHEALGIALRHLVEARHAIQEAGRALEGGAA